MDLNHAMYTPTPQEFEAIASGQGSPTCEGLDLEPIHFNVVGNLMSHGCHPPKSKNNVSMHI